MTEDTEQPTTRSLALDDNGYAALASFRRSLRTFLTFSEQAALTAGLPPQQHQAILAIRGFASENGLTVGDLAKHLLLKHHTTVELVNRLARSGLVLRRPDPLDGRRVFLSLTPKAMTVLDDLSVAHLEEIRRGAPALIELLCQMAK